MPVCTRIVSASPVVLALVALVSPAQAACLADDRVAGLVAGYPTTPVPAIPPDLSLDDAYCSQAKYVALLGDTMGVPVGYKVGFTGAALQSGSRSIARRPASCSTRCSSRAAARSASTSATGQ